MNTNKIPDRPPKPPDISQNPSTLHGPNALKNIAPGPKFLIMKRSDNGKTLTTVSPFLIKKCIDNVIHGTLELCKKLRDGTILIKTQNINQASALMKMGKLTPDINIQITEHTKLNHSKGVIYNTDLIYLTDEEILSELKDQNIIAIKRITKKINLEETQTGLFILTFATTSIPNKINIGYEKVEVRHYIPRPIQCWNCFHFGHATTTCKKNKKCINCDNDYHFEPNKQTHQKCENSTKCANCLSNTHNAIYKKCPIFTKQIEIMKIKTIEQTDLKTAKAIYARRHININIDNSFASIVKNNKTNETINKTTQQVNYSTQSNNSKISNPKLNLTNHTTIPITHKALSNTTNEKTNTQIIWENTTNVTQQSNISATLNTNDHTMETEDTTDDDTQTSDAQRATYTTLKGKKRGRPRKQHTGHSPTTKKKN